VEANSSPSGGDVHSQLQVEAARDGWSRRVCTENSIIAMKSLFSDDAAPISSLFFELITRSHVDGAWLCNNARQSQPLMMVAGRDLSFYRRVSSSP